MSKLIVSTLAGGILALAALATAPNPAGAAELPLPAPAVEHGAPSCGPCGCLHVSYEHHRELLSTYGIHFDPRKYDQTQPHYYFGSVRAYPRYWCDQALEP